MCVCVCVCVCVCACVCACVCNKQGIHTVHKEFFLKLKTTHSCCKNKTLCWFRTFSLLTVFVKNQFVRNDNREKMTESCKFASLRIKYFKLFITKFIAWYFMQLIPHEYTYNIHIMFHKMMQLTFKAVSNHLWKWNDCELISASNAHYLYSVISVYLTTVQNFFLCPNHSNIAWKFPNKQLIQVAVN